MRPLLSCKSQKDTFPIPRLDINRPAITTSLPSRASKFSLMLAESLLMGKALLGKNAGDDVTVDAPGGLVEYKLLKIER